MFYDEILRNPKSEKEMWEILREQFWVVRNILWELPVQERKHVTREEEWDLMSGYGQYIAYRGDPPDDPRNDILKSAEELLPLVHQLLDEQRLTPQFVQAWGKIMFYAGFIGSYVLGAPDDQGHLAGGAARARATRLRKKWIAKIMLPLLDKGKTREQAEIIVAERIHEILAEGKFQPPFDGAWFKSLLSNDGLGLSGTFGFKKFYTKEMAQLAAETDDDIPLY